MIGSVFAGVAGVLLAPIVGVQIVTLTHLIVPALAAALIGGLRSFPLTYLGALLIGVSQAEVTRYISTPGWADAVPFLLIVIVMVWRGAGERIRSPSSSAGPRSAPDRSAPLLLLGLVGGAIVLLTTVFDLSYVTAATITCTYGIILLSSVVITGYTGQLSLSQFSFAGVGAVITGLLLTGAELPFLLAIALSLIATFAVGAVLGVPLLRTRGVNGASSGAPGGAKPASGRRMVAEAVAARRRAQVVTGLRGLVRPPAPTDADAAAAEWCDLCRTSIPGDHRHLLHLVERRIVCVCESCWALRSGDPSTGRREPHGVAARHPDARRLWASFQIPIGLAFFMDSTTAGCVVALYPSPAGATESELHFDRGAGWWS